MLDKITPITDRKPALASVQTTPELDEFIKIVQPMCSRALENRAPLNLLLTPTFKRMQRIISAETNAIDPDTLKLNGLGETARLAGHDLYLLFRPKNNDFMTAFWSFLGRSNNEESLLDIKDEVISFPAFAQHFKNSRPADFKYYKTKFENFYKRFKGLAKTIEQADKNSKIRTDYSNSKFNFDASELLKTLNQKEQFSLAKSNFDKYFNPDFDFESPSVSSQDYKFLKLTFFHLEQYVSASKYAHKYFETLEKSKLSLFQTSATLKKTVAYMTPDFVTFTFDLLSSSKHKPVHPPQTTFQSFSA